MDYLQEHWMDFALMVAQLTGALVAAWAAFAAWKAAKAAEHSTALANKELEVQHQSLAISRQDLESRNHPQLTAVFRLDGNDQLFIDISNYGGPAHHLKLSKPTPTKIGHPLKQKLNESAFELLEASEIYRHGIDCLRPRETVVWHVGRYIRKVLIDEPAMELIAKAHDERRPQLWYSLQIEHSDGISQQLLLLDKTSLHRQLGDSCRNTRDTD